MKLEPRALGALVAALWLAGGCPVHAQEIVRARNIAAVCANCHSIHDAQPGAIPPITMNDRVSLVQRLKDYKSGARPATVMHQLARGFTDAQLEEIAAFLSAATPQ